jgi:hypothetical protein
MASDLKFNITGDASGFLKAVATAKQAAAGLNQSGGSGQGGGQNTPNAAPINQAQIAQNKYNQSVSQGVSKLNLLEKASAFYKDQPKQLAEINKQMAAVYNTQSKLATNEVDYAKAIDMRNQHMEKANKLYTEYSAHSNRQFEQLKGLALSQAGSALRGVGGGLYNASQNAYTSLNDKYQFDTNLTNSQRAKTRAELSQGQRLSGLYQAGNNLTSGLANSPIGDLLAVGGTGLGAAGGLLQLAGALKTLKPVAGGGGAVAGLANLSKGAGAAASAGSGLAETAGAAAPAGIGLGAGAGYAGLAALAAGGIFSISSLTGSAMRGSKDAIGDIGNDFVQLNPFSSEEEKKKAALKKYKNSAEYDKQSKDKQALVDQAIGESPEAQKANALKTVKTDLAKSEPFKLQTQKMANQKADFEQDQARQTFELKRSFARQEADFKKAEIREDEDYSRTQMKFKIQRARMDQDYYKESSRAAADYNKTLKRADEDYARSYQQIQINNSRFQRDQEISLTRFHQDQAIAKTRFDQDQALEAKRLAEDIGKSTIRATQDSNLDRFRADQDYARNRMQLERQTARSIEDLNKGLGDTLLSIVAPGLSGNKGYQLMKALRDYNIQKKRIGEDSATAGQNLNTDYQRQLQDISKNLSRTLEDLGIQAKRAAEDMQIAAQRFAEDQQLAAQRAEADALKASQDQLIDSTLALSDLNRQYARTIEDTNLSYSRSMEDLNTSYARSLQDLEIAQTDAAIAHSRALEDLALAEQRGKEDFKTSMENIQIAGDRFARDFDISIKETAQNIGSEFGVAVEDMQKLYQIISSQIAGQASNSGNPPPQHAGGLYNVPIDNYPALLHAGEMVLTKNQADSFRAGSSAGGQTFSGSGLYNDGEKFGKGMAKPLDQVASKLVEGIKTSLQTGGKTAATYIKTAVTPAYDTIGGGTNTPGYYGPGGVSTGPNVGGGRVVPPASRGGGTVVTFTINANNQATTDLLVKHARNFTHLLGNSLS